MVKGRCVGYGPEGFPPGHFRRFMTSMIARNNPLADSVMGCLREGRRLHTGYFILVFYKDEWPHG